MAIRECKAIFVEGITSQSNLLVINLLERVCFDIEPICIDIPTGLAVVFEVVFSIVFVGEAGRHFANISCGVWTTAVVGVTYVAVAWRAGRGADAAHQFCNKVISVEVSTLI